VSRPAGWFEILSTGDPAGVRKKSGHVGAIDR